MPQYSVILFYSTSHAMWTSNTLNKKGYEHKLIPVPRHLSSDCGYCVRIKYEDAETVEKLIHETGIEFDRIEAL